MMALLAINDPDSRGVLGAFAAILCVLAAVIFGVSSRWASVRESEDAYVDA